MDFEESLDVLARLLQGNGKDLPFRDFVEALAAYFRSNANLPGNTTLMEWPQARYALLLSRAPEGLFKCSQSGGGGRVPAAKNPTDDWRSAVINDAVQRALEEFDALRLEQLRTRFDEENAEANRFFVFTNFDENFLFQSYIAFRAATTTAKLMGPAGLVEQVTAYGARVNVSEILISSRGMGWAEIHYQDLDEYERLLDIFLNEAAPTPIDQATIRWDPVSVRGGPGTGEDTVKTHVARAIVDGRLERIYVGTDFYTDFSGGAPPPRADHQAEALKKVEEMNAERQMEFDTLVGTALGNLKESVSEASAAWRATVQQ